MRQWSAAALHARSTSTVQATKSATTLTYPGLAATPLAAVISGTVSSRTFTPISVSPLRKGETKAVTTPGLACVALILLFRPLFHSLSITCCTLVTKIYVVLVVLLEGFILAELLHG